MNLQDELTQEFLSWVLGADILMVNDVLDNTLRYRRKGIDYKLKSNVKNIHLFDTINLDTLTRLIKEKILSQHKYSIIIDYNVDMFRSDSLRFYLSLVTRDGVTKFKVKDCEELEAVIKAGKWVMENLK